MAIWYLLLHGLLSLFLSRLRNLLRLVYHFAWLHLIHLFDWLILLLLKAVYHMLVIILVWTLVKLNLSHYFLKSIISLYLNSWIFYWGNFSSLFWYWFNLFSRSCCWLNFFSWFRYCFSFLSWFCYCFYFLCWLYYWLRSISIFELWFDLFLHLPNYRENLLLLAWTKRENWWPLFVCFALIIRNNLNDHLVSFFDILIKHAINIMNLLPRTYDGVQFYPYAS